MEHPQEKEYVAITGGASGIGRGIADLYREGGASIAICDADPKAIETYLAKHPDDIAIVADISSEGDVNNFFDAIDGRMGTLTCLVNSAGIAGPSGPVEEMDLGDWQETLDVDITGQFLCVRRAIPLIKKAGGGSITNIASSAAFHGYPFRSPYVASKWAMIGLTKTWAMELGKDKIRVNAICPGSVRGARIDAVMEKEAITRGVDMEHVRQSYVQHTSLKTFVSARDIAEMACFLSSPAGQFITGQAIGVDGHQESLSHLDL
jgi:NAD(P)-dependent dehydrogenase (short-subunit alcohol dehydrogenase family)